MGVTIFYKGRLQDPGSASLLVLELQLACQKLGWPYYLIGERVIGIAEYHTYETDANDYVHTIIETEPLDDQWQGILIQPPECESLWLTFNRSGQLIVYEEPFEADTPGRYHAREQLWCKTQFGTVETHIAICDLLRQVEPYMAEFKVIDEGGYWETQDRDGLAVALYRIHRALDLLTRPENLKRLGELIGEEIEADDFEIGKRLEHRLPLWRDGERGLSANEN